MTFADFTPALTGLYGPELPHFTVQRLPGHASARVYARIEVSEPPPGKPERMVAMCLPEDAFKSDEGGDELTRERLPFLEMAETFHARGVPAPAILQEDLAHGVILLEDLGNLTLEAHLRQTPREHWGAVYGKAVELLAQMHDACAELPVDSIAAQRRFDGALLRWELDHFREWGLECLFGKLSRQASEMLSHAFDRIVAELQAMPFGFVHRDYQSRNLMVKPDGALAVIDFQDALQGPRVYDLVALLCDSYVALSEALQEELIAQYAAHRGLDEQQITREFWWVSLHRKLKDAGRFVYIDRERGNPDFLQWYPQSLVYVGRALAKLSEMGDLDALLLNTIPGFPNKVRKPSPVLE